jgi:4'-phosphopantetheinyl transferase
MDYQIVMKEQYEIIPDLSLLDTTELARYQRLLRPQKQLEFLTGRTFLKQMLADCLGLAPNVISLSVTDTGKPYLPALAETRFPYFNLSHSDGHYLVGLSRFPIGVDIEAPRPIELHQVQPFLSTDEFRQLDLLPQLQRSAAFFRLFTAKEAFLKATDMRWKLDEISFHLENQHWKLNAPHGPFQFYQTHYRGCCVAVCLDATSATRANSVNGSSSH